MNEGKYLYITVFTNEGIFVRSFRTGTGCGTAIKYWELLKYSTK